MMTNNAENEDSDQSVHILSEYEAMFANRYTEKDKAYMEVFTSEDSRPPCVENWFVKNKRTFSFRGRGGGGGYNHNRGRGGYESRDQDRGYKRSYDNRDGGYRNDKRHRNGGYNDRGRRNDSYNDHGRRNDYSRSQHYENR